MARIPYVETESASEDVRAVLEQMPANLNIFRMAAHAETNLRPLLTLGVSVLTNQKLDDRLRELAILRVARLTSAEYEWVQHVPIARLTGASDEEIAALERDDIEADCFDDKARAVLRFASEVNRSIGASQEAFDAAACAQINLRRKDRPIWRQVTVPVGMAPAVFVPLLAVLFIGRGVIAVVGLGGA